MKYKFDLEYIHQSFIDAHPAMHPSHPDFVAATSRSSIELEHDIDPGVDQVKLNIESSLNADGCHLLKITGGRVE